MSAVIIRLPFDSACVRIQGPVADLLPDNFDETYEFGDAPEFDIPAALSFPDRFAVYLIGVVSGCTLWMGLCAAVPASLGWFFLGWRSLAIETYVMCIVSLASFLIWFHFDLSIRNRNWDCDRLRGTIAP